MNLKNAYFYNIFNRVSNTGKIPKIDFHIHTSWTDGENSVVEMYKKCSKLKFETILYSEHSRSSSSDWFKKFSKQVKNLKIINNCYPLVGTEVKILNFKGKLDLSKEVQKECAIVMASVHRFPGEVFDERKKLAEQLNYSKKTNIIETELNMILGAINNPDVDILGHPLGMCIKRFGIIPDQKYFDYIIEMAKKKEKIFEINFRYHYDYKSLTNLCLKKKCLFSYGSNSHSTHDLEIYAKKFEKS